MTNPERTRQTDKDPKEGWINKKFKQILTLDLILSAVKRVYGISYDLGSRCRMREYVDPRNMYFLISWMLLGNFDIKNTKKNAIPLRIIGAHINQQDPFNHATVINGIRQMKNLIDSYEKEKRLYENVLKIINFESDEA